ncbi:CNNM [Mytilus edulis]|uniref:CNNM n=1 Tax=Mytilus edulis TaxID=6550 RepID=A0A8S3V0K6_MYTED|nr:CNNM [Mytilus edulis]
MGNRNTTTLKKKSVTQTAFTWFRTRTRTVNKAATMYGKIHEQLNISIIGQRVIPQSITSKHGLAIGATLSPLVYVLIAITCIVTWPISKVLDCLLGTEQGTFYKRSQFKVLVDLHGDGECSENGLEEPFTQDEVKIIKSTLDMKVKTADDILVPIDEVYMLNVDDTLNKDTLKVLQEMEFSRIPIYEGNRNNIVTVLLTKTLLCLDPYQAIPIRALISSKATRDVIFVQPDLPLFELLYELKGPKGHLAFVREQSNSYALAPKILGIITLEDLMEELLQEDILDETNVDVTNTKRTSISQVFEKQHRKRIQTTISPISKRNYLSVSVPEMDVAPIYNNTKNSSRQSIPCILESTGKTQMKHCL